MNVDPALVVLFHHFRRLLEAAAREGIDVAPLKGAHLLTSVYSHREDRGPMVDVDFLVRPCDWERALAVLQGLGFRLRPETRDETQLHEAGFLMDVGLRHQFLFELHRYLFDPRRLPIDHEAIWKRSLPSTFEGLPCRRLCNEDHFVHIATHAAIHRLINLKRNLRDLELLLRRTQLDRDLAIEIAREWRMSRAVWLLLALLHEMNPDLTLQPWAEKLAPSRAARTALRLLAPDGQTTRLAGLNHRIQAALLWPWLFDTSLGALRFAVHHPRLAGGRRRGRSSRLGAAAVDRQGHRGP